MIDHYCERTGPGLWAEPFNALSNLAFVIVAFVLWRQLARQPESGPSQRVLIVLIGVLGVASFAWHSAATPWARRLDILALLLFQTGWLWVYLREALGLSLRWSGLALLGLALGLLPAASQVDGSNPLPLYLPTLVVLFALGLHRRLRIRHAPNRLLAAAAMFAIALVLRTLDEPLCTAFPLGTHFAWHLLDAIVVWLAMRSLAPAPVVARAGAAS